MLSPIATFKICFLQTSVMPHKVSWKIQFALMSNISRTKYNTLLNILTSNANFHALPNLPWCKILQGHLLHLDDLSNLTSSDLDRIRVNERPKNYPKTTPQNFGNFSVREGGRPSLADVLPLPHRPPGGQQESLIVECSVWCLTRGTWLRCYLPRWWLFLLQRLCLPTWDGASCIPPTPAGTTFVGCNRHRPELVQNQTKADLKSWLECDDKSTLVILGATAVFPCMSSAFGVDYSPECKQ